MGRELAAIIAGAMMPSLDTTIVSIGIASLMEAFQVSEAAVQWVSTAYLLALAVAIPVVGWAEECFGGGADASSPGGLEPCLPALPQAA